MGRESYMDTDMHLDDTGVKSIRKVILGFMLTMMTFNFFALQYILPTVGVCLIYLGFRQLRNENRWFKITWIFSAINIIIQILQLIYISTPLHTIFNDTVLIVIFTAIFQVSFIIVFRNGVKQVFIESDEIFNKDPILALAIWKMVATILALMKLGNFIFISIPIILCYFYLFIKVYKLLDTLGGLNYKIKVMKLRVNSKLFIILYSLLSIVVVFICCVLSNSCKLDSNEFMNSDITGTRTKLMNLGFPREILNDISDDVVNMLQRATYVQCDTELLRYDRDDESTYKGGNDNLEATTIFVEIDDGKIYGLEYFQWEEGGAHWNDIFTVSGSERIEAISGRLLYKYDGKVYSAPIPKLKNSMITETDILGDENQCEVISGVVSYPWKADDQRGYVFYLVNAYNDLCVGSNIFNYTHYGNPIRIPYADIENRTSFGNKNLRQHCTNYFTKAYRESEQ